MITNHYPSPRVRGEGLGEGDKIINSPCYLFSHQDFEPGRMLPG